MVAKINRGPTAEDLTDAEWKLVAPLIPGQGGGGRPRKLSMRVIVDAILYLDRTGCPWRNLPPHFPNPSSVRTYYDRWRRDGVWARICAVLEGVASES